MLTARYQHLTTRADDPLTRGQAHAALAAALLCWLHVIVTQRVPWDPQSRLGSKLRKQTRCGEADGLHEQRTQPQGQKVSRRLGRYRSAVEVDDPGNHTNGSRWPTASGPPRGATPAKRDDARRADVHHHRCARRDAALISGPVRGPSAWILSVSARKWRLALMD